MLSQHVVKAEIFYSTTIFTISRLKRRTKVSWKSDDPWKSCYMNSKQYFFMLEDVRLISPFSTFYYETNIYEILEKRTSV